MNHWHLLDLELEVSSLREKVELLQRPAEIRRRLGDQESLRLERLAAENEAFKTVIEKLSSKVALLEQQSHRRCLEDRYPTRALSLVKGCALELSQDKALEP